ncbi:MAG: pyridoxal phosphate-dependent aminotransferase, partial [Dysgonamonadaceae bacterium]|nr:pyridoxal phosphate-dependent aminotransferase [Dysgonamonadaceae bacterium]
MIIDMQISVSQTAIRQALQELKIDDISKATIREVVAMAGKIERETGLEFIHMEMGVPGLPPAAVGVEAEIAALQKGVAAIYPVIDGLPE